MKIILASQSPRRLEILNKHGIEPIVIPADIDEFTNEIWNNLDEDNKISLYVRYTDLETGKQDVRLINKNK